MPKTKALGRIHKVIQKSQWTHLYAGLKIVIEKDTISCFDTGLPRAQPPETELVPRGGFSDNPNG